MITVASIVEGEGDVASLPILLRRLHQRYGSAEELRLPTPIRVRRDRFLNRDDELRRHLQLAAGKCGEFGWILILLDADDDCPVELAARVTAQARQHVSHRQLSVVLANHEFESWFIAAAASLDGQRGFVLAGAPPAKPEHPRNAKGWIANQMGGRGYHERTDQPAFASCMNLDQAHQGSRSFRKLCSEWQKQCPRQG